MRIHFTLLLALWVPALLAPTLIAPALIAQESGLVVLETGEDGRGWEGVGRLDIAGKGFCTAALIQDDLILTAAHCIYDHDNSLLTADRFTFQAGLRNGRAEATRNVARFAAHPAYLPDGPGADVAGVALDIAVLQLDRPIRHMRIHPFPVAADPARGDEIGVVSYGAGREEAPSLQEVCSVLGHTRGAIVMTCDIVHGSSGAPVFTLRGGAPRIVSVVSALASAQGEKVSLGTSLQRPLQELLAHFATLGAAPDDGTQNILRLGQTQSSGAKFVRP